MTEPGGATVGVPTSGSSEQVHLLVQAAVLSAAGGVSAEKRREASDFIEGWVRGRKAGEAELESSWDSAAELLTVLYPHAHRRLVEAVIVNLAQQSSHGRRGGHHHGHHGQLPDHELEGAAIAARTLLLTQLCSKLRRSPPTTTTTVGGGAVLARLAEAIWSGLVSVGSSSTRSANSSTAELNQLCCAAAALASLSPRGIVGLVQRAVASSPSLGHPGLETSPISPSTALRLLSKVPTEASECCARPASEIDAEMADCCGMVLAVLGTAVSKSLSNLTEGKTGGIRDVEGATLALRVLGNWSEPCHVTLTQLNAPFPSGEKSPNLISLLIGVLSQIPSDADENLIMSASQALMVTLLEGSDHGTPTRLAAVSALLRSIPDSGFLTNPLKYANMAGWDDAARSLSDLASTLATEEVDLVVQCNLRGCPELLDLLLGLQSHPNTSLAVSIAPLEAWLAIQDVPLSHRHPDLAAPLFGRIVDNISWRAMYPATFVNWEEELNVDRQEFEDLRRLASDVLVSSFFLLGAEYVNRVVGSVATRGETWEATEAALWCLVTVAREVCDSVKKSARGGKSQGTEEIVGKLLHLARASCVVGGAGNHQHPLVVSAVSSFLGSFAPVWNVHCPAETILEILTYLRGSMGTEIPEAADASAKAIRQVLVGCSSRLVAFARQLAGDNNAVVADLGITLDAVLGSPSEEGIRLVAEGCARLCIQLQDGPLVRRSLCIVVDPVLRRVRHALDLIIRSVNDPQETAADAARVEASCQTLASSIGSLEVIIRFCDEPIRENGGGAPSHPLADALVGIWQLLSEVSAVPICRKHEDVISSVLDVHSSLLSSAPDLVGPHFSSVVSSVVQAYEEQKLPCSLDYVAAAIETFGSVENTETVRSFNELLAHLSRCTIAYVTQETRPSECPQVIKSFFDMARRYLLYCPSSLTNCPEFETVFSLGVGCLEECRGERESTRATLNFLAQTVGYRQIRLSPSASATLLATSSAIDAAVLQHGEAITKACVVSLSGGAPQMLWPSYSECLFALMAHLCSSSSTNGEQLAHQWMMTALSDSVIDAKRIEPDTKNSILRILFSFAKDGNKSKIRAKMLLGDFGKLCNGETTSDALIAYSMQA